MKINFQRIILLFLSLKISTTLTLEAHWKPYDQEIRYRNRSSPFIVTNLDGANSNLWVTGFVDTIYDRGFQQNICPMFIYNPLQFKFVESRLTKHRNSTLAECQRLKAAKINGNTTSSLFLNIINGTYVELYSYDLNKFGYEGRSKIFNNLSFDIFGEKLLNPGMDYNVIKPNVHIGDEDYLVFYQRSSNASGFYPSKFQSLFLGTYGNTYGSRSMPRTLTYTWKKLRPNPKNSLPNATYTQIDQINWIPDHYTPDDYAGMFISGKGTVSGSPQKEEDSVTAPGDLSCVGAISSENIENNSTNLAYLLDTWVNKNYNVYAGTISYASGIDWYYSINPGNGMLKVCRPKQRTFFLMGDNGGQSQLEGNCIQNIDGSLKLRTNEYYSNVNILNDTSTRLTIVSIMKKGDTSKFRQVVVQLGSGTAPTFDLHTYYYAADYTSIWRVKKVIPASEPIIISQYQIIQVVENPEVEEKSEEHVQDDKLAHEYFKLKESLAKVEQES